MSVFVIPYLLIIAIGFIVGWAIAGAWNRASDRADMGVDRNYKPLPKPAKWTSAFKPEEAKK